MHLRLVVGHHGEAHGKAVVGHLGNGKLSTSRVEASELMLGHDRTIAINDLHRVDARHPRRRVDLNGVEAAQVGGAHGGARGKGKDLFLRYRDLARKDLADQGVGKRRRQQVEVQRLDHPRCL